MLDKFKERSFSDIYEIEYKNGEGRDKIMRFTVGSWLRERTYQITLITEKPDSFHIKGYAEYAIFTTKVGEENQHPKLWRTVPSIICVATYNQE